jgi:hypothetical protein
VATLSEYGPRSHAYARGCRERDAAEETIGPSGPRGSAGRDRRVEMTAYVIVQWMKRDLDNAFMES